MGIHTICEVGVVDCTVEEGLLVAPVDSVLLDEPDGFCEEVVLDEAFDGL